MKQIAKLYNLFYTLYLKLFMRGRIRIEGGIVITSYSIHYTKLYEIDQGGGPKIPMVYEMGRTDAGWKVYDVSVNGVSLVITYRSSFAQEIKRNGIDGLIKRLKEKNIAENG